ncbi:MAG: hypothetical protein ABIE22_03895 [archaeon]
MIKSRTTPYCDQCGVEFNKKGEEAKAHGALPDAPERLEAGAVFMGKLNGGASQVYHIVTGEGGSVSEETHDNNYRTLAAVVSYNEMDWRYGGVTVLGRGDKAVPYARGAGDSDLERIPDEAVQELCGDNRFKAIYDRAVGARKAA